MRRPTIPGLGSRRPLFGPDWRYEDSQATTSGTLADFSVGPNAEDIIVGLVGVSWDGTQKPIIQIGDSSIKTSGYAAGGMNVAGASVSASNEAEGFPLTSAASAAFVYDGFVHLTLIDPTSNLWACNVSLGVTGGGTFVTRGSGIASLPGLIETVRMTSKATPSNFDAGTAYLKWRERVT